MLQSEHWFDAKKPQHRTPPPPPRQHSICNRSRQLTAVTHRPPLAQRDKSHSGPQASPLPGGIAGSGRALADEPQRPAGPAPPDPTRLDPARPAASAPRSAPALPRPARGPPWPPPGCNGGKPTKQAPPPAAAHGEEQRAEPLPAAPEGPLPARSVSPAAAGPGRALRRRRAPLACRHLRRWAGPPGAAAGPCGPARGVAVATAAVGRLRRGARLSAPQGPPAAAASRSLRSDPSRPVPRGLPVLPPGRDRGEARSSRRPRAPGPNARSSPGLGSSY
ncbi:basic proline-rich protein-like [Aquila chrysaetos chrysaetos]|uniref:basic proline-rich protein-like n=1 Tax=Aquila chrysaetos chrysaetos TaxID=223781 RepID=UPI0011772306|nr:basic proline-rich protein-like [Aquila chrysaetos chrysaetos]